MSENELTSLSRREWEELIDNYIYNEKYRLIIKRRLLDGITHERIAEEVDMSTRQIKNIVKQCTNTLSRKLH